MGKGRILIIEDEAIVADDILYCLQETGYEVPLVCSSGEDALTALKSEKVDLALVDILLAGKMDGIETALQIRALYQLPVVYLTSFTNESIIKRAKETTPSGYIVKPFKRRELLATVEMALYHGQIQQGVSASFKTDSGGQWLLKAWLEWLKQSSASANALQENLTVDLLPEREKRLKQTAQLISVLSIFSEMKLGEISKLEQVESLLKTLFQIFHPHRQVEFIHEPEADSIAVACAPLLLAEILFFTLNSVAQTVPDVDLIFKAGLLPTNDSNASFLNLVPGNHTRFEISLKPSPNSNLASNRTILDHLLASSEIQHALLKSGGVLIQLSDEAGKLTGFQFYLPFK